MKTLNAAETRAALPYGALVAALLDMFEQQRRGDASAAPRSVTALPGGVMLLMPAINRRFAALKVVTVHNANISSKANQAHSLPAVQSDMLLMDAITGERLLRLDGNVVTNRRTAALSIAGAQRAGCTNARTLLLIGAGAQARAHAEALIGLWGVQRIWVHARGAAACVALAADLRALGADATYIADPASVAPRADLVVCATTSLTPVVPENLRRDAIVIAVGAFRPDMAEVPAALVRRAHIYVDTIEGAQAEAGDLIQAQVDWSGVQSFASARPVASPRQPILVKTVGHALWDLAAATLALSQTSQDNAIA